MNLTGKRETYERAVERDIRKSGNIVIAWKDKLSFSGRNILWVSFHVVTAIVAERVDTCTRACPSRRGAQEEGWVEAEHGQ